ncbi:MAG: hypothetical protein U9R44_03605 [Candidatus Omnitrophota bacterium]|nr:hypothetical protein [Candidatus Omnitrophota bacterium]
MRKKKNYVQSCDLSGSVKGKRNQPCKKVSHLNKRVSKKILRDIYNKYYRNQVADLYRAVIN